MRWKTAWNRPTGYVFALVGVAVAVFGFLAAQQRSLLIVFIIVGVLYIAACSLFLYLAWKAGKGS